ncbi:TonB-dependent receptor [Novosphingobium sp. G106]|uniref:TonB-dependent receptor n=1 Tax=Novosphingobium sp. G106 TaxID=2849500 RepID=UPI001C2D5AD5|nr:TonB-dependent receptor [Novosphingobium sp. G106]MBV1687944.1 TonB-dependent receptor [Novosphingobium sp. G106]
MEKGFGSLARSAGVSAMALVLGMLSTTAHADAAADAESGTAPATGIAEGSDIVVTATRANEIAPATSSLEARQPQSIVSRSLIEDSLPATADFDQIALITPSVSNFGGNNGIGLGESKAQIRGFQDGEYNITYDGVPFGDTNDPTHHSTTFFPSNTIETIVVDRGPGNASQLGQASFGGNINLFSRAARDDFGGQLKASYGSFDTWLLRGLLNTGAIDALGGTKLVVTGQYVDTNGRSSHSPYKNYNLFAKAVVPVSPDVTLTLLGTYNHNKFNQPDKDGSTLYQQSLYGKHFSLNDDPTTEQYFGYNHTTKTTDFEIVKLEAQIAPGSTLENRAYTYYYDNETLSANDVTVWDKSTLSTTLADGKTKVAGDVPGYTKTNKYRVYGDIAKLKVQLAPIATLTVGAQIEWSRTYRQQTDVDLTTGGFNYVEKAVTAPPPPAIATNPGEKTPQYIKFDQNSQGNNAAEFVELEIKPVPGLSITPGFKHVDYNRKIFARWNQTTRYAQNLTNTYDANLPFLQANWQVSPQLSFYGEYARGFLIPSLTSLYVANPSFSNVVPERSTNYQAGFVFHGDHLSVDADVYSIDFKNKFASTNDPVFGTVWTNIGGALYQGIEGQVTYAVTQDLGIFANGSLNRAIEKTTRLQVGQAPKYTAAGGVIVKHGPIRFSLIDKLTGPQYANSPTVPGPTDSAATTAQNRALYFAYRIKAYNTAILAASYEIGPFRVGVEVTDLFNSQNVVTITSTGKTALNQIGLPLNTNFDQYYYQPGRAVSGDITFTF